MSDVPPEGREPEPPPGDAPAEQPVAEAELPEPRCWRCGNPHDPFQEYCLECGARLVPLPGGVRATTLFSRESPFLFWGALLGLVALALVVAGIVLASGDDDGAGAAASSGLTPTTVPLTPSTTAPITTSTLPETVLPPTASISVPSLTTTTQPFPTTTVRTTTGTTTTSGGFAQWPAGKNGWTIFVASVPKSQGRAAAERKAREAKNNGLPEVGIIDTDQYSSLENGYYGVFTGIYDTEAEARSHVAEARSQGYPSAYVKDVRR